MGLPEMVKRESIMSHDSVEESWRSRREVRYGGGESVSA